MKIINRGSSIKCATNSELTLITGTFQKGLNSKREEVIYISSKERNQPRVYYTFPITSLTSHVLKNRGWGLRRKDITSSEWYSYKYNEDWGYSLDPNTKKRCEIITSCDQVMSEPFKIVKGGSQCKRVDASLSPLIKEGDSIEGYFAFTESCDNVPLWYIRHKNQIFYWIGEQDSMKEADHFYLLRQYWGTPCRITLINHFYYNQRLWRVDPI